MGAASRSLGLPGQMHDSVDDGMPLTAPLAFPQNETYKGVTFDPDGSIITCETVSFP